MIAVLLTLGTVLAAAPDTENMATVSGATFTMGHPDVAMGPYGNNWKSNQLPPHTVTVATFLLDTTEVMVKDYARFLNDLLPHGSAEPHHHPLQPLRFVDGAFEPARPHESTTPIRMVSWYDAATYCAWAGKRLPTEAEFERAMKGADEVDRPYPWGRDRPTCDTAVFFTNEALCESRPQPVGSRSVDSYSPEGIADLSGNVAEWVSDWYAPYTADTLDNPRGPDTGQHKVLRGGGFRDSADGLRSMDRLGVAPARRSEGIGFRCAVTP